MRIFDLRQHLQMVKKGSKSVNDFVVEIVRIVDAFAVDEDSTID